MFYSVSLFSQAPLARGSRALPSVLFNKASHLKPLTVWRNEAIFKISDRYTHTQYCNPQACMLRVNNSFELKCIAGLEKKISATMLDLHGRLVDRLFPFRYDKCCVPDYNHIQVYLHTIKHIFIRNHKSRNRNTGKRKCNLGFEAEFPVIINF